ncbi:site-specific integrase [Acidithiobacillus ferriphilus]
MADLKATFGELVLSEINGQRLALMVKHWEQPSDAHPKGLGAHSIRLYLALISHLYTIARSEWGMPELVNPVPLIRKPKLPRGRDRRLIGNEEERLLAVCEKTNPELADIVRFAIETAMRQVEIMGLTWDRIDFRSHTAFLQDTKNGESRVVPLSVVAEDCLKQQRERREGATKGKVWSYTTEGMRASYFKALKKAGIEGMTFHDLRHEATSRLCERGLPIMTVQAITGHKSTQMLKRYTHISPAALVTKKPSDFRNSPHGRAFRSPHSRAEEFLPVSRGAAIAPCPARSAESADRPPPGGSPVFPLCRATPCVVPLMRIA